MEEDGLHAEVGDAAAAGRNAIVTIEPLGAVGRTARLSALDNSHASIVALLEIPDADLGRDTLAVQT